MTRERALELAETAIEAWRIVGGKASIAEAILLAVAEEREACAKILDEAAGQLIGGNRRARGADAHVAWILEDQAFKIRERGIPLKVGA